MKSYLKIDHVDKTFNRGSRETEVLKDVTLGVEQGEYVSIIGHSGCGKTTLLNIVAGLIPVTRGAVLLENQEVNEPGPDRAVVFQNHSLLPWLTVYDNVRLAVDKVFSGTRSRAERDQWTMHNLELVQMAHAKDKRPAEISGGMKQRVGLARALAMEPKVLLLDEPFGALDALTRAHLQDSVMAIHQKLGNTVLMITHDVDEAVLLVRPHRDDDQRAGGAHRRGARRAAGAAAPAARAVGQRDLPQVPPARARIPLRAPPLRRSSVTARCRRLHARAEALPRGIRLRAVGRARASARPAPARLTKTEPVGPDAIHIKAQDAVLAAGKKLSDQEKFKREQHPFDAYARLKEQAAKNEAPKPADNFRWRYYGLFYCAPAQNSYMCRLRIPNGILKHWQMSRPRRSRRPLRRRLFARDHPRQSADARGRAEERGRHGGGDPDLGLCSRGSGADNIRNVTGTPTAGIDPQELIDTRPYAREWHFHILNERALYGLPRKFNVAFDGGGIIPVLEDTNDIGFPGRRGVAGRGRRAGVWFRLALGGITGHRDFARDTGVVVPARSEATAVADAIVRVFIEHGDRTDRNKARLKYVLDRLGIERSWPRSRRSSDASSTASPPERSRRARCSIGRRMIGVHAQKQPGLNWIGVVLPVGKLTTEQMRGLAQARRRAGRRRSAADGLAEPPDLRRAGRQGRRGLCADRSARPFDLGDLDPRRPCRLHRQPRLPLRRLRHQAARRGHRALVRRAASRSTRR